MMTFLYASSETCLQRKAEEIVNHDISFVIGKEVGGAYMKCGRLEDIPVLSCCAVWL